MTDTLHLALPMIAAAQAQKHVTHNEALRALDALVMLSVLDRDLTAPPGSPADGARYLVKATGTDGFAGKDGQIAHFRDGAWAFHIPRAGWIAYVADEEAIVVHNGTTWEPLPGGISSLQDVPLFGLATIADATNPISAVLNNALFAARTVADGGDGDLRYKLSKATAGDTVSLLFQDNFSGRAEIGLAGDDDLHLKVSSDGTIWHESLVISAATGKVSFPQGTVGLRETLSANRTYYVRTDGSDSNNGLANSSGGAFLTLQKAIDTAGALDIGIHDVLISVGAGTYTAGIMVNGPWVGLGTVTLQGDTTTPSNVLINPTGANCVKVQNGGRLTVRGFKLQTTTSGHGLYAANGGNIQVTGAMEYGALQDCLRAEMLSSITISANYTISGNQRYHYLSFGNSNISMNSLTVTLTGTPAWSNGMAVAQGGGYIRALAMTYSGSATGKRYEVTTNAVVQTNGGGASYFPGNSAGSVASDGTYE